MRVNLFIPALYNTNRQILNFSADPRINNKVKSDEYSDLRVFHHHIYEYKKGIRNLILTTEKAKYRNSIEKRLASEKIAYVIHEIPNGKINVYFGEKDCVDVVKTFTPKLNELSAEQDFMLGIMLGYDRVRQCERYLKIKNNIIKLKSNKTFDG